MTETVPDTKHPSRRALLHKLIPMTAEQPKGRRAIETGPTGHTVASNLQRLRKARGLTTRQLSAALERAGRPVPSSGITRMEKGERQINADDLAALAVVLGVSPSALLLPLDDRPGGAFEVTGAGEVRADVAWDWADGKRPLRAAPAVAEHDTEETAALWYLLYGRPPVRRKAESRRDLQLGEVPARGARTASELAADRRMYERLSEVQATALEAFMRQDPEAFEVQSDG